MKHVYCCLAVVSAVHISAAALSAAQNRLTEPEQRVLSAFMLAQPGAVYLDTTDSGAPRRKASRLREQSQEFDAGLREAVSDLLQKSRAEALVTFPTNEASRLSPKTPATTNGPTVFRVSRIGVDKAMTTALLYASQGRNGWGHARFYVLRNQAGVWRITDERILPMEDIYGSSSYEQRSTPPLNQRIEPMTSSASVSVLHSDASGPLLVTAHPPRWARVAKS